MYNVKGKKGKNDVLEQHAPLVKKLAHQLKAKLPPSVEVDDLIQAGMMGLLDALSRYEETQGVQFEFYAAQRIRGAILDPWYYRLVVRDHGVTPEKRELALQRIRHALRLRTDRRVDGDRGEHRGYGVALMLAKVLMVRHHGWMAAAAPSEGDGVEIHLVLPRVEHEVIPAQASHPGRYLAELQARPA